MKLSSVWGALVKAGQFVYEHPEAIEVIAASTGHPGVAAGIGTVVAARNASKNAGAPAPVPVTPAPVAPAPVAPAPAPEQPSGVQPEVDLVGKWRGTLDRMSMEILNHRMAEDELFNNAKLLEAGKPEEVAKNLRAKL